MGPRGRLSPQPARRRWPRARAPYYNKERKERKKGVEGGKKIGASRGPRMRDGGASARTQLACAALDEREEDRRTQAPPPLSCSQYPLWFQGNPTGYPPRHGDGGMGPRGRLSPQPARRRWPRARAQRERSGSRPRVPWPRRREARCGVLPRCPAKPGVVRGDGGSCARNNRACRARDRARETAPRASFAPVGDRAGCARI